MWVLRSKVNGKLFSDVDTTTEEEELVWDDDNPWKFGRENDAWFARLFVDQDDVWQMVAEEIE